MHGRATESRRRALTRLGTVLLGKYRVEKLLGVGGMAAVYAATHRNGTRVALKVLHAEYAASEEVRSRFLREGYVANRVGHSGTVRVLDDDTDEDGTAVLVIELLEGETVLQRAARSGGRLPVKEVLHITFRALDVLAAAHAKDIIHRDIKPENLFAMQAGTVRVLDFGIARVRDPEFGPSGATRTGVAMGTPAFMAPEQALGRSRDVDGRTDIWAAGATMFKLLTGREVHEGESAQEVLVYAATRAACSIRELIDVPSPVAEVVDRALRFDRADRWTTADAMRGAVRDAYAEIFHSSIESGSLPAPPHEADGSLPEERASPGQVVRAQTPGSVEDPAPRPRSGSAGRSTVDPLGDTDARSTRQEMTAPATEDERLPRVQRSRRAIVGVTVLALAASSLLVVRNIQSPRSITPADSAVSRSSQEESPPSRGEPAPPPSTAPEVSPTSATSRVPTKDPQPRALPRREPAPPRRGSVAAGSQPYDAGVPRRSDPLENLDFQ